MSNPNEFPPLHDSDDSDIEQEASFNASPSKSKPVQPFPGSSDTTNTPSNTPVVNLFSKVPSSSTSNKRGFEAPPSNPELVNKMLSALNIGTEAGKKAAPKAPQNDDDDDEDEDEDENEDEEDNEEEEEEEEYIATKEQVDLALPKLRENQEKINALKLDYQIARRELEIQFQEKYKVFYNQRAELTRGDILPGFWLDAIQKNMLLSQCVEEWDEPCLMFLDSIDCCELVSPDNTEFGFELEFHFAENPFFTNKSLKKKIVAMNHYPRDTSAYPDIVVCDGCDIDWKPNQKLTVRIEIKKEVKRAARRGGAKNKGPAKEVRQEVPQESFFTFFDTPLDLTPEEMEELADEEQHQIQRKWETDYAMATTFRSKLLPDAMLWYTGEASESEYEDDEDEEGDEDEDDDEDQDDDDDDDDEDDDVPKKKGPKPSAKSNQAGGEGKEQECNQQ